ncbi:putative GNAT family acetyltransferase [Actinocorallia herbida]|uniref:Putative GNAT family acetyltransferase n=1 Tax=Actinocorallia herbida TaxID=58109 RepID=A0A3N1CWZ8_9ACTN|nr:GNAT family N-acetyltransferase [Actinocorallia herbida]ROO85786.1 putative GNAT family acetyltransferase [Actinocorallia herbida]
MTADPHPLDDPIRAALTGPHAHFAEWRGGVVRYPVDVAPFLSLPDPATDADWADAAALAGPGGLVPLVGGSAAPEGWELTMDLAGVQMTGESVAAVPDPEAVRLTPADVPEMLALVARTNPGPFRPRTITMGSYLGIRHNGRLIAMAGERLHPPGWTEISAVCTDPAHRAQGLATRLIHTLATQIRARDELPFLHALATNTPAIHLYRSLGFHLRRPTTFTAAKVPTP